MTVQPLPFEEQPEGAARAEPRLLALRVHGFKSFAERTIVEFGPGISAVVGPNGSGKSNLADALRWALGEQGRALRSRKSEDVIWAGSDKRPAQGMADVSLVIDNADGLLPVEYQVLELGRRLYRSGENDYLLNRTRIRLRELVDLLDAAHLADNAFLFIGQGMVDQALALRPEERRPLFDEVAGVRRHERRRRRAEDQLAESEANLARVEDILGELRPQARRLAVQAEQQATRQSTADELTAALLTAMHARWHDAAARLAGTNRARERARVEADDAMRALSVAEAAASTLAHERAARAALERERAIALETVGAEGNAIRLREARLAADAEAIGRDRERLALERATADAAADAARRALSTPVPARDLELEAAVAAADRELGAALEELAALRGARQANDQAFAAVERAAAARRAEVETADRRLADAERRLADEMAQGNLLADRRRTLEAEATAARDALTLANETARATAARRRLAREHIAAAEASRAAAEAVLAGASTAVASVRARLEALDASLADEESRGIARAARRVGGHRLDEDLVVEPALRRAVEAALGEMTRAYLVAANAVSELAGERGALVVGERASAAPAEDGRERRFRDRLAESGGATLDGAVRRDGHGAARRLLARSAWLPDLDACLAIQPHLPPGWVVVPRDGSGAVSDLVVTLGSPESVLERRAERDRLAVAVQDREAELGRAQAAASTAAREAVSAADEVDAAGAAEAGATAVRRAAEEAERLAARRLETAVREAAWHEAQLERLSAEAERARGAVVALESSRSSAAAPPSAVASAASAPEAAGDTGLAAWEARARDLRAGRDRLAAELAEADAGRRELEHARARAEAALHDAEDRAARADRELTSLGERERALAAERESIRDAAAAVQAREQLAREALDAIRASEAADRGRLDETEADATAARERLRAADERLRAADHADLEAMLGLEALRENVVAELAGLGALALEHLGAVGGRIPPADDGSTRPSDWTTIPDASLEDGSDDVVALEQAIARATAVWAELEPDAPPPSPARLGQLRRRFHELGAVNPFAVDEYAAVRARLESLEGQATDLRTAIARTRDLIVELDGMISDRFERTFRALESAFERRFEQLFGGGYARLSLTDPSDVGASGIEIVARPPGKKPQALAMLSGGERALTAVALLFAMLEVRPVPFCVLDEVDAALDEANIGRFADALRSLAHRTQFIVITHNRGTIEAADALYGVTSGDDSVSRVISLRLDEAQALAARDRAELAPAG